MFNESELNEMETIDEIVSVREFMEARIHMSHPESFLRGLALKDLSLEHLNQIKTGYKIFQE